MNKSALLDWLQEEHQQWQALLEQVGPTRMEQPGVNGDWTMKDLVAHLSGWNRRLVDRLQAAAKGRPEPPPPWPGQLQTDDEINAWIYESYRGRSLREVVEETNQAFQKIFAEVQGLPEDVQIEQVHQKDRVYHLIWLGQGRFQPGEFFDHFHDDHEPDVRRWLAQIDKQ